MKKQPRWIKSTIKAADECKVQMPWERGARRAEFIARRQDEAERSRVTLAPLPAWMTQQISA